MAHFLCVFYIMMVLTLYIAVYRAVVCVRVDTRQNTLVRGLARKALVFISYY